MKIVVYGLSITSSWGNGHATTYRSMAKALARRGHEVHFIEKNVEWYRSNRDLPEPDFCTLHLYEDWPADAQRLLHVALDADAIVIGSYFPDANVVARALLAKKEAPLLFYDIDTPVTLSRLRRGAGVEYLDPELIQHYDAYLSFSGGRVLRELQTVYGSPRAIPFYCSVDPDLYKPQPCRDAYRCDLSYLGTFAKDRQVALALFVYGAATALPAGKILVAGAQYPTGIVWPATVRRISHVPPCDHASFYSSSRCTLNLTRADMKASGYSPSVRLFEAAACGAVIASDMWDGLEHFLTPGEEIIVPKDEYELGEIIRGLSDTERCRLGKRARERILEQHSSAHRAAQFEEIVSKCYSASVRGSNNSAKEFRQRSGWAAQSCS
jgi:spore maturation protein CgeB